LLLEDTVLLEAGSVTSALPLDVRVLTEEKVHVL
jgi:hypothetical protein